MFEQLNFPEDCEIVSVEEGEEQSDAIYNISEGEGMEELQCNMNTILMENVFICERKEDHGGLDQVRGTEHKYKYPKISLNANIYGKLMKKSLGINPHANAAKGKHKGGIEEIKRLQAELETQQVRNNEEKQIREQAIQLVEENLKLKHEIKEWEHKYKRIEEEVMNLDRMIFEKEDLRKEIQKLKEDSAYQKGKQIKDNEDEEEINMLLIDKTQKVLTLSSPEVTPSRKAKNMLYNLRHRGDDVLCRPEFSSSTTLEENPFLVHFSGITLKTTARKKLKGGRMIIGENTFRIPYTCIPHELRGKYPNDPRLQLHKGNVGRSQNRRKHVASIEELELEEDDYIKIQELVYYFTGETQKYFKDKFVDILSELRAQGYIGEDPLKHLSKNQVVCQLDIKNSDFTTEDRPLKHLTPQMKESFSKHVKALLDIGVIRPSKSRHRTTAIIVNSGTTIDPKIGQEVKGKERMVFNYRHLNDITNKDQYSLPGINTILKKKNQIAAPHNQENHSVQQERLNHKKRVKIMAGMEGEKTGPATYDCRSPPRAQGKAQLEGGNPPPKDDTQDLVQLYRVKVEEIKERTKIGLRLDILHEAERLLGQIQKEAAQQAIKSLQQYRVIHSIKLQEYKQ
ncbi:uncharacterized protein LOC122029234 [Zingiber officinale]|uniref:uncharacterized protein LOC122029234 n=1 Tax=Zingiber officinale TaxID=94328 RepID=UPI001C4DAD06|nr:uncharacterized protein LOC122029234 [Zingiber officinale]